MTTSTTTVRAFSAMVPNASTTSVGLGYEVANVFRFNQPGLITAMWFYRDPASTVITRLTKIWDATTQLPLGFPQATPAPESGSGWFQVPLADAISVTWGQKIIVGYSAPAGETIHYDTNPYAPETPTISWLSGALGTKDLLPVTTNPNLYAVDISFVPYYPPTPVGLDAQLVSTDPSVAAAAAEALSADAFVNPEFDITVYDQFWRPIGAVGDDMLEFSGTDPRNTLPSATLKISGISPLIDLFMNCRTTMVGVTAETGGQRFAFYVDTFDQEMTEKGEWVGTANLLGIWDVLNYHVIWPDWTLPIQAQVKSYAVFISPLVTAIEHMIAEQALRIQAGLYEFINNVLSLNTDFHAWYGTLLQSNGNIATMLKTPLYVVRTDTLSDTSPLYARTVRMETVAAVLKDITKAYGVDIRVDLWLPGDAQPDYWSQNFALMRLDQPTYVVTVKDRSQITGPTKTVLDSVLRTVVDLEGSVQGNVLQPLLNPQGLYAPEGVYIAPRLGLNFVMPWVLVVAPEPGQRGSVATCKISDHTPKGWQHIIGGRSPKWVGAPLGNRRGTGPRPLTQRPHERHVRLDHRFHHHSSGRHRHSLRPALGVPE